jgi:L,D-transpeptidase YbiS
MMRPLSLMLLLLVAGRLWANGDTSSMASPRLQGLMDLMLEYVELRYPEVALHGDILYVSVHRQRMFHVRNGRLVQDYAIATASNGLGSERDSYKTPTGLHYIREKIGAGVPLFGIFRDRRFTGELADPGTIPSDQDPITTRILWLTGGEPGHNQGGYLDSHSRYIYIHGTANEASLGTPSSRGCIRMHNTDVAHLFDQVPAGAAVLIFDN